ncbi:MAG: zf-HC2 domain-containing protein [Microthrixaceae bacterium]
MDPREPDCDEVRAAMSAALDGEDPGLSRAQVRRHLDGCPACRRVADDMDRLAGAPGLPERVAARAAELDRGGVWWVLRALLALVALGYLVTAVPEVLLSNDPHHGHLAHHLGIFEAAYGVTLLFVAARPARARALVPFTVVLAVGMVAFAVVDVANGEAFPLSEMSHLLEVAGLVLVWLLATRRGWPRPDAAAGDAPAGSGPAATPHLSVVPGDTATRRPAGGAGRLAG